MNKINQVLGAGMFLIMSMHTQANIKQNIEKQGFVFVKQIPAPQGMTGWVGHEDQYSNTVFISNDDKYYIKGELFDAQGKSLSNEQIEKAYEKSGIGRCMENPGKIDLDPGWQARCTTGGLCLFRSELPILL